MRLFYHFFLGLTGSIGIMGASRAQAPFVLTQLPQVNATAAPRTTDVQLTFSQPMSAQAAAPDAVRVVSSWRGALAGTYSGAGTPTIRFAPSRPLLGGEHVQVTVTNRATSQAGTAPASSVAYQFRVATASSTGQFLDEDVRVGPYPQGIAVGDINKDGNLDFVVSRSSDVSVAVRLGNGQGGFARPTAPLSDQISTGGNDPRALVLADANNDGNLDLFATNTASLGRVSVCFGDGSGRFTTSGASQFLVGSMPQGLAVGDVNGDGNLDFVTTLGRPDPVVLVWLGNGQGGFRTAPAVPLGSYAQAVTLADVNSDERLDILTANSTTAGSSVSVRLGNGAGGFTAPAVPEVSVGAGASGLAVGDANGDGKVDVFTANSDANSVSVRLGNGAGGFMAPAAPEVRVGQTPRTMVVGDVNRDGKLDFVTANNESTSTTLSVRLGDGTGAFTTAPQAEVPVGLAPLPLVLTDVNKDGQPDLLTGNSGVQYSFTTASTSTVSVRLGDGTGRFVVPGGSRVAAAGYIRAMRVGDVNNDGNVDLLTVNNTGTVSVRLGTSTGRFAPAATAEVSVSSGSIPSGLAIGDLNNDGKLDFVTQSFVQFNSILVVRLGDGLGGFTASTASPVSTGSDDIQLVDLTGDGNLDVLGVNTSNDRVSVRLGNGSGGFTVPPVAEIPVGDAPMAVAVGDVNGDGKLDLLTANYGSIAGVGGSISIRLGNGAGGFVSPAVAELSLGTVYQPNSLALGDLNGDGKLDVVTSNARGYNGNGNNVSVRLGDGSGAFTSAPVAEVAVGTDPTGVALGDLNGDGKLDFATSGSSYNQASVRFGNGQGGFLAPSTSTEIGVGPQPTDITMADVDSDGDLDLLLPNGADNSVSVRLNGGSTNTVLTNHQALLPVKKLMLYPNPAHHTVFVEGAASATPLVLYDLLGREFRRQPVGPSLNLSGVAAGLYILRCGTQSAHLVVE